MNKAFVKEDVLREEPELQMDPRADIPDGHKNYMTPGGKEDLEILDLSYQEIV